MKVVSVVSGGLDSVVMAYRLCGGYEQHILTFDYGQVNRKEIDCAGLRAARIGVPWTVVDVSGVFGAIGGSDLTGKGVVDGDYHSTRSSHFVPNRNAIFQTIAVGFADTHDASAIAVGHLRPTRGEPVHPDTGVRFLDAFDAMECIAMGRTITTLAPFAAEGMTKVDVIKLGVKLGVPFWQTWSCFNDDRRPCGRCGACIARAEAFAKAGVVDR